MSKDIDLEKELDSIVIGGVLGLSLGIDGKQSVKSLIESVCMEVIGKNDDMSAGNHIPKWRNKLRSIQRQTLQTILNKGDK